MFILLEPKRIHLIKELLTLENPNKSFEIVEIELKIM
jgi:hypothetical protein